MLQPVSVAQKHLSDYASIVGRPLVDEIRERAARLAGKRILHVSATAFGGGVSEILYTLVPLMIDVGLECEWQVIYGREEFFNATKLMHNALQGSPDDLSRRAVGHLAALQRDQRRASSAATGTCASSTTPSPRRWPRWSPERARHWVWRCHIDLSTPNPDTLSQLSRYFDPYEAAVFHMPEYVPAGIDGRAHIVPPAIDPLAPKNMAFAPEDARLHLRAVRDRRRPSAAVPGLAL